MGARAYVVSVIYVVEELTSRAVKPRNLQRLIAQGLDELRGRFHPHIGPHAQKPRGVEVHLRTWDIGLHDPAALPGGLAIGLDPAEQRNQLEALCAALANADAQREPFAATAVDLVGP